MLTQKEADDLLSLRKWLASQAEVELVAGQNRSYDLDSTEASEKFILDLWRGTIRLRARYQTRARKSIVLVRLDLNGAPHTNPDGEIVDCPHLHVYKEGYGDKWAFPVTSDAFSDPSQLDVAFRDFCTYCNITIPTFSTVLL